jgi:molybdopterin synthase catalytic subunit
LKECGKRINGRIKAMANSVCKVLVTEQPLRDAADSPSRTGIAAATEDVDLKAGAVVDFWGVVRQLEDGRKIEGIDYEAHATMAEHQMKLIANAAAEKFQLRRVMLHHRIGFVRAGEASLFLRVRATHRGAAFDASKWIVDELKKKVPIWKRIRFADKTELPPVSPSRTGVAAATTL